MTIAFLVLVAGVAMLVATIAGPQADAFTQTSSESATGSLGTVGSSQQSVVWSTIIQGSLCNACHFGRLSIQTPAVSVQYAVSIADAETGLPIPSGSTVPAGTKVRFAFEPHVFSDVYWFATGSFMSSPYGTWITSQKQGPGSTVDQVPQEAGGSFQDLCTENNFTARMRGRGNYDIFTSLAVNAPMKRIEGLGGYTCTPVAPIGPAPVSGVGYLDGGGMECTFDAEGTIQSDFIFDATHGHFYIGVGNVDGDPNSCGPARNTTDGGALLNGDSRYTLSVPAQVISHTLTIGPTDPDALPPTAPTVAAAGAACVVGTSYTITMTATDPDGDRLRYLIDWNNDGAVDQIVPASGSVDSGTAQTAARTHATAGAKTLRVRAEDETGVRSAWAALSFSCAQDEMTEATVPLFGDDGATLNGQDAAGASSADLQLRAVPSLVRSGSTTRVTWSATGVESCAVTGTNGDEWVGTESPVGGEASGSIRGQTVYTLACTDRSGAAHSRTATVNIVPTWQER